MENAAEALKMAGAVLLFVLAFSIILFSFGQARESADTILDYRDRETAYIDTDYYYKEAGTERNVNLDTIVPSIFRAYLENYKIVFDGLDKPIYKIKNKNGDTIDKYTLDLETIQNLSYNNVVLANNEKKNKFLKIVFYGGYDTKDLNKLGIVIDNGCASLYKQLNDKIADDYKIKEYLGVYYQDDNEDVPETNKIQKRIITYKITREN